MERGGTGMSADRQEDDATAHAAKTQMAVHGWPSELIAQLRERAEKAEAELRASLAARDEERQRHFGGYRSPGSSHTTACSIWGDNGQGGTKENFPEPLPCNCGALENFQRSRAEAAEAALAAALAEHKKSEEGFRAVIAKWRNDYDTLSVRYTRAMEALRRLGSMEAFEGSRAVNRKHPADQELLTRIDYARAAVSGLDKALASSGEGEG